MNAKNKNGSTPVHLAASNNAVESLKILLSQPTVDVIIKDNNGRTPLDRAKLKGT